MAGLQVRANHDKVKNISLVILSILFLPLDSFVVILTTVCTVVFSSETARRRIKSQKDDDFVSKNILVTGVGMSKGLAIARSFYAAGHNVVGADFDALACGRVSTSLSRFYQLTKPNSSIGSSQYIEDLLNIISRHKIDLWVSCSGVASAVEDGEAKEVVEAKTACKAIQFDVATTQLLHEKNSFIQRAGEVGLNTPDTHTIPDHEQGWTILQNADPSRKYIMKPIGMDDANRGDMTLLPKKYSHDTKSHLSKLCISKASPWILQQFIRGPEYCTHALVVDGKVKIFVACQSAELLMHYEALPAESRLTQAMLQFTQKFAKHHGHGFTGHLSFDFMVEETDHNEWPTLYPIECNPRAHTAVVLFNETSEMARAYLTVLGSSAETDDNIVRPARTDRYYWIGHDLGEFLFAPVWSFSLAEPLQSFSTLIQCITTILQHILFWRDGTFETWDPWPWWLLYHCYWPKQFLRALWNGKGWSRINVSTTKMFER